MTDKGREEKALGQRLQEARQRAGLTQQALCHQADLSYSTLAKIERGAIKAPSIFTIQSIAEALHTSLDALVGVKPVATTPKKRTKSGVSFIYFDVNGCLVRFFHRAFTKLAEDTDVPSDVIETAFWHINDAVCRGHLTMAEFNKQLARKVGLKSLDWQAYYLAAVDPIKNMQQLVAWAAANYRIGLLTNIMPGFLAAMRQRGLVPDLAYDAVIDSSEVHMIKPDPKIYQLATAKTGCEPGEILLVDDDRTNLMAAEKTGWHVLWFDDYQTTDSVARLKAVLEAED